MALKPLVRVLSYQYCRDDCGVGASLHMAHYVFLQDFVESARLACRHRSQLVAPVDLEWSK